MSYNKFQFIGNITHDTELIVHAYGFERAILNIAVNEVWEIGDTTQEKTEYFNITCLGTEAINATHLRKGSLIFVEGRIETSIFEKVLSKSRVETNHAIYFIAKKILHLDSEKFDLKNKHKYKKTEIVEDEDW